ncbi:SDR family NAD(P)-dependent oxidoreductase [Aromatoleum evansii]|uniref:SDR family NAD(P)-dependent oxidoreductase n=1 Tax=Aromatoleum evansii TaxID=59406 RepID=UPI00145FB131|nr:SDR family NAD(P)-dependent oxidoreductase [Aromatoleum evansii]NMG31558.1 glucose 1-dehydrogenase [Aromatoleum evansii]
MKEPGSGLLGGKVAVITGAGQGIGRGVALRLAVEGARVVVSDINAQAAAETVSLIRSHGADADAIGCDIADSASMEELVRDVVGRFGALDILVNNAYLGNLPGPLEAKPAADFARALQGSLYAPLAAMQSAFPHMKARRYGRIINMCSLNGVNAHPYTADYNVSKEALRCLTRSAAREWAAHGITVNAICPAARTPAYERFAAASPENAALLLKQNPMGRMGEAEQDIGNVVAFLCSDGAGYMTGNTLFVDGGSHINGVSWLPSVA